MDDQFTSSVVIDGLYPGILDLNPSLGVVDISSVVIFFKSLEIRSAISRRLLSAEKIKKSKVSVILKNI